MTNLLAGTRKLLGKEYKDFCEAMLYAADEDALPFALKLEETFGVTCQDIGDLCHDFEKDTGLEMTAHFFICHDCGKLHMQLEIDYPEEEGEEGTMYLQ